MGIVVLNKKTEEAILRDGKLSDADASPVGAADKPAG